MSLKMNRIFKIIYAFLELKLHVQKRAASKANYSITKGSGLPTLLRKQLIDSMHKVIGNYSNE